MLDKLKIPICGLSDQETQVFQLALKFSEEIDDFQIDRQAEITPELFKKLSANGFFGIGYPSELGGCYVSDVAVGLVILAISFKCASTGIVLSVHNSLVGAILNSFLNDDQKNYWIPRLASGEMVSCFCLSESEAGSDVRSIKAVLTSQSNHYLLDGEKAWVTNGPYASLGIVFAKQNNEISACLVDLGSKGVKKHEAEDKLGIRGAKTCSISFSNVEIQQNHLISFNGNGLKVALHGLNHGRLGVACQSLGIGWRAFYEAFNYASNRKAFGQAIINYQMIQDYLADMRTKLDHATCFTFSILRNSKRLPRECCEAKLFASNVANECVDKALQIFGGNGYVKDFVVERLYRDVRITKIYEGSSEIQKLNIVKFLQKEFS